MSKVDNITVMAKNSSVLPFKSYNHIEAEKELSHAEGLEQGLEQGLVQGERMTLIRLVKSMLKKGQNYNEISDTLELPVSEVKKYAKMT